MEAEDTADEAGAMQIMKEAMHMRAALDATMEREFGIMGATALDGDGLVTAFEAAKTVTSKPRHGVGAGPGREIRGGAAWGQGHAEGAGFTGMWSPGQQGGKFRGRGRGGSGCGCGSGSQMDSCP